MKIKLGASTWTYDPVEYNGKRIMLVRDIGGVIPAEDYEVLRSVRGIDEYALVAGYVRNGNYYTLYLNDGTRVRFSSGDSLEPEYPECIDMTITKHCDGGCPWCYMNCTTSGEHAELDEDWARRLLDQIHPYTELAVNGNDLSHPKLRWFLEHMAERHVFVNITVNQKHFMQHYDMLKHLIAAGLIRGIGISYMHPEDGFIERAKSLGSAAVIHVIAGIFTPDDWEYLKNNDLQLLVLGYKRIGRGETYYESDCREDISKMMIVLRNLIKYWHLDPGHFDYRSIAFDGLSIRQLDVEQWLDPDAYREAYAGGEGAYTFYLDMVDRTYAMSSIVNDPRPIGDLGVDEMFHTIQTSGLHN